jgi:Hint domain
MSHKFAKAILVVAAFLLVLPACKSQTTPSTLPTYNQYQLEYRLFGQYDVFWCDPDFYPVANPVSEQAKAIATFPTIQANQQEFSAILDYLLLEVKTSYSDDEKLLIYRQYKKLTYAVQISTSAGGYDFILRTGQNQGWRYEGFIDQDGTITVETKATSFNTCPICLTKGTLIDTPSGQVAVEQLKTGDMVWTLDGAGNRVAVLLLKTTSTPVPASFEVVKVTLADGRTVMASPGHPSAGFKALGDYRVGDVLDGSRVVSTVLIPYSSGATYDILPAGGTGLYWANGILLLSTLA